VTDILNDYVLEHGAEVMASDRIAYAVPPLTDFFEGNTVADITEETCRRYHETRARSAGTVRRELGVLRAAINHAHKRGRLTRVVPVNLPERPPARERWLTRSEVARLLRAAMTPQARLYLPLFILVALYTGRRKQAVLALRWAQVDLVAGRIDFDVPGRSRTNKRRGKVPIPPRLLPHLRRARRRGSDVGYVLHVDGARIGDIKKGFKAACDRAGLAGVSPHTLKHTCATWLMQAGTDLWTAAGFLSTSVEVLQNTYGHHHPDFMRDAAENIGRRPRNVRGIA
jgi:integrase